MVKKLVISILLCVSLLLSACTGETTNAKIEIKAKVEDAMECFYNKDTEKLIEFFSRDICENRKEETIEEINSLYDFMEGEIESYEYISEGSIEQKKSEGEVYFYWCTPKYNIILNNGKKYKVRINYYYIWNDKPEYEGICNIKITEDKEDGSDVMAGIPYYECEVK